MNLTFYVKNNFYFSHNYKFENLLKKFWETILDIFFSVIKRRPYDEWNNIMFLDLNTEFKHFNW